MSTAALELIHGQLAGVQSCINAGAKRMVFSLLQESVARANERLLCYQTGNLVKTVGHD